MYGFSCPTPEAKIPGTKKTSYPTEDAPKNEPQDRPQGWLAAESMGPTPGPMEPMRLQERARYPRHTQSRPLITKW